VVAAIEWGKLLQVMWVSLVAGVGVTAVFSTVIYGTTRAAESRRDGQAVAAALFGALASFAMLCFISGVIFGVSVILQK